MNIKYGFIVVPLRRKQFEDMKNQPSTSERAGTSGDSGNTSQLNISEPTIQNKEIIE